MIKHIVMWKFRDMAEGKTKNENCKFVKQMLDDLTDIIPQIKKIEIGINTNSSNMAFDMCLCSEFESEADLEIYKNHSEHIKVSDYVTKIRLERAVVDYKI